LSGYFIAHLLSNKHRARSGETHLLIGVLDC